MKGCKEDRSTRQVALGLRDRRLYRERVHVVRRNIENLIELVQRFRKATESDIGLPMLSEHVNIPWVEPLGFVEVGLAPVPLTSPPRDIG